MATCKFFLKKANKKGLCPVMFIYQDCGNKFRYYTKVQTFPAAWDGKRIKGKTLEVLDSNSKLDEIDRIMKEIEREALAKETVYSIEIVEKKFRIKTNKNADQSEFFLLYDQFIEESRTTKANNTIKQYVATGTVLRDFEKSINKRIQFENMNQRYYESLINYLIEERGLINNSVGKHIKTLKTFLNYLLRNELIKGKINMQGFKVFKEDIDILHLSEEELFKIYHLDDLSEKYSFVRDYFCLECFTGLRFSDISNLSNENVKGDFLEFKTRKTKDTLYVPLNVFAKQILAKYKDRFAGRPLPPTLHNSITNKYLKDIAEAAGVNEPTVIERFSGSKRAEVKKPKCDFISTHTGRRTFITLSHEKGMPVEMIMKITGIKKWETLRKYLKVSEKAKLLQMNKVWNLNSLKAV